MAECELYLPILTLVVLYSYIGLSGIIAFSERISSNSSPISSTIHDASTVLSSVLFNLKSHPVVDLQLVPSSEDCPINYKAERLATWSTIKRWCWCPSYVAARSCFSFEFLCRNKTRWNFDIFNWKGVKICLQRLEKDHWESSNSIGHCSSYNFQKCPDGLFCVRKETPLCPINAVLLGASAPAGSYQKVPFPKGTGWGQDVYFSKEAKSPPLLSFQVSITSLPCINVKRDPQRRSGLVFPILNENPEGCDQYGADGQSFKSLDSQQEWKLYEDNFIDKKLDNIPGLRRFIGEEEALFLARFRIELNRKRNECLLQDYEALHEPTTKVSALEGVRIVSNLLSILAMFLAIGINGYLVWVYKGFSFPRLDHFQLGVGITASGALLAVICSAVSNHYISEIEAVKDQLLSVGNSNCFTNEHYNQLFEELRNYLLYDFGRASSFARMNMTTAVAFLALLIIYLIYLAYQGMASGRFNYEAV